MGLRFGVGPDDEPPREVSVDVRDGSREWAQSVLNGTVVGTAEIDVAAAGKHVLRIYGVDADVVLDKMTITDRRRCLGDAAARRQQLCVSGTDSQAGVSRESIDRNRQTPTRIGIRIDRILSEY